MMAEPGGGDSDTGRRVGHSATTVGCESQMEQDEAWHGDVDRATHGEGARRLFVVPNAHLDMLHQVANLDARQNAGARDLGSHEARC